MVPKDALQSRLAAACVISADLASGVVLSDKGPPPRQPTSLLLLANHQPAEGKSKTGVQAARSDKDSAGRWERRLNTEWPQQMSSDMALQRAGSPQSP